MKYRKKPVVIEAEKFAPGGIANPEFDDAVCKKKHFLEAIEKPGYHIHTLEGTSYTLSDGDWIITGIKGEFYPCKPDIFEAAYEKAEEDQKR